MDDPARIEDGGVDQAELLKAMLGRLNICSREYVIRQYDHEVQGGSVVKPLVGAKNDGDASNPANEDNFITLKLEVDLSDGRFKANDLKNLYFDLTSLDAQP